MRIKISQITTSDIGKELTVKGWIKTSRFSKNFGFVEINDGSQFNNFQVIVSEDLKNFEDASKLATTGASVSVSGKLVASPGKGQAFEMQAKTFDIIGLCDPETYPLQKKKHTLEFLRTIAHLRPRTNTIGAIARVRNALAWATHEFFQKRGFIYVNTPIITGSDCEGAGEMFRVSTLDAKNPPLIDGKVDFSQDYFGKETFLTVSGQLNGECYALALSDIYTFGPTFRGENSNTSRHLSEFWMIEPEMAFAELSDDMECAQSYLKHCVKTALEKCPQDMEFFDKFVEPGLIKRLQHVIESPFEHLTYTHAIDILKKAPKKFDYPVSWGIDLQSEHEKYIVEEHCKKPVILTNYPKEIKAFYMKEDADGKTVAAMDTLVAGVGEILGGSQREDNLDLLTKKMDHLGLNKENYWWYLELRKYGSVPHAGFGLGFERLVVFTTGIDNIRDAIPFPRYPKHADF
ncbi:MAG: Asparagine-tRNA ligase [candidate division TM6 bacterium GW2011_GWF2_37_49]|nr:MAG: Asparagine-tRNA ligase [candidate division TM6 bacterium GW2011_GWF2_37_49]